MKVTGGAFKEFSTGDECRQSARTVRERLNSLGPQEPDPTPLAPMNEAELAGAMELETTPPIVLAMNAIVEATATKFGLTFHEAMTGLEPQSVTARKIGVALVIRRLEIEVAEVVKLFDMPRDSIVDGLLLIDPILRERAIPRTAPLPDVLQLIIDAQAIVAEARRVSVADVKRAVCIESGVHMNDLLSDRRTQNIVVPRQVAMALAKRLTLKSLPELGRQFGGRDHTTVLHAVRKFEPVIEAVGQALPADARPIDWVRAIFASSVAPIMRPRLLRRALAAAA